MARRQRALVGVLVIGVGLLAGCSVDGAPGSSPAEVSAYSAELSASREAQVRAAAADFCSQVISSMGTMATSYNDFLRRLNEIQNYAGVGALADRTRTTLGAGIDRIEEQLGDDVPSELAVPTQALLATTGRLIRAIENEATDGLNPISDQWTGERRDVLSACEKYLPLPPESSRPDAPGATSSQPGTSVPVPEPTSEPPTP